ncbi:hypothetical protein Tco_0309813 [Tanacetum coccineum]
MITTNNKIEGKKPLGLMLPPQLKIVGMLETFPCVKDAPCITQDLALSSVRLATRWVIRPGTAETKGQPLESLRGNKDIPKNTIQTLRIPSDAHLVITNALACNHGPQEPARARQSMNSMLTPPKIEAVKDWGMLLPHP